MNGTGTLVMRAERVGSETLLAQIVQMVARRSAAARRFRNWRIACRDISFPSFWWSRRRYVCGLGSWGPSTAHGPRAGERRGGC